jgi:glycosyltransferase involved in cell wall biosynthesis
LSISFAELAFVKRKFSVANRPSSIVHRSSSIVHRPSSIVSVAKQILVIIPAYNEAESIGKVVRDIPAGLVREVVVVNNNSTDATEANARAAGATVLRENRKGYGFACLCGIAYADAKQGADRPDIIVFIDGDYSDFPAQMPALVNPILHEGYDMVIGSRALGAKEKGAMTPQQIFGNWLATTLIRWFYRTRYTDLGPFRAIRFEKLLALDMKDQTYGWTVEMQLKAAKKKFKVTEVPVDYRRRIGVSKVSGTVKGTILAGYKILYTIFRYL